MKHIGNTRKLATDHAIVSQTPYPYHSSRNISSTKCSILEQTNAFRCSYRYRDVFTQNHTFKTNKSLKEVTTMILSKANILQINYILQKSSLVFLSLCRGCIMRSMIYSFLLHIDTLSYLHPCMFSVRFLQFGKMSTYVAVVAVITFSFLLRC